MRRGWVWPMLRRPSRRQILGSWVVFPEPVSPATTTTWLSRMSPAISSAWALIGREGSTSRSGSSATGSSRVSGVSGMSAQA